MKLLLLIWLHFIGDYPLQGNFLADFKSKNDYILLCHSIIWTGTISLGLHFLGLLNIGKVFFLLIGHFWIDRWKARKKDKSKALTRDLWIDQLLHMVQIVLVYIS